MPDLSRARPPIVLLSSVLAAVLVAPPPAVAVDTQPLTRVSTDPYTDAQSQHSTEVGPDTFAHGDTIVATFQAGRRHESVGMGASNLGVVTSTDRGRTWTETFLPGTTLNTGGPHRAVTDASVAYDARHDVWLVSMLAMDGPSGTPVLTSRSTDGGRTWADPVTTVTGSADKNWVVCDNHESSPHYGNCYTQYGDNDASELRMTTSADGGRTWSPPAAAADHARGSSGQPVVRTDGAVVVPYLNQGDTEVRAFGSTDGGASWTASTLVSPLSHHHVAGGLKEYPLPSAEVDAAGTVYLVWSDCRFRTGCPANDIVLSTSRHGQTWSEPVRVPAGPRHGTADHFVPGIGVDPASAGGTARIGLTYYFHADADCTASTCSLGVGYLSSTDGGAHWSRTTRLAGGMRVPWLPDAFEGRMFGEYISTSVLSGGNAVPVVPIARRPVGDRFDVAMYAPTGGLPVTGGPIPATRRAAQ